MPISQYQHHITDNLDLTGIAQQQYACILSSVLDTVISISTPQVYAEFITLMEGVSENQVSRAKPRRPKQPSERLQWLLASGWALWLGLIRSRPGPFLWRGQMETSS